MKRTAAMILVFLVAAVCLAGCTSASAAVVYTDLTSLLAASEYTDFSLPTSLPAGFLQTELSWANEHTCRVSYKDGQRELTFMAAPKQQDQYITNQTKDLPEQALLEINGLAVAFYQQQQDLSGEGLMLWSQGDMVYSLGEVTPQEGAGMIYSMKNADSLKGDSTLGRPRQSYDSLAALEEALDVSMPQPISLADNYAFSCCYAVGDRIAVAEYTNGTDILTYQASISSLINEPTLGTHTEDETFFSGTEQQVTVTLPYRPGESIRPDAQWQIGDVYYRLTCSGEVTREQILTLAREFCSWMENAG